MIGQEVEIVELIPLDGVEPLKIVEHRQLILLDLVELLFSLAPRLRSPWQGGGGSSEGVGWVDRGGTGLGFLLTP
ncbi:MAG: hypothetical protein Fur0034_03730 [Desulfuromonadia bacterium]